MKWPFHFLDLSKEEKVQRRHLLDWYGALAQVSILVPLLVLQLYFLVVWLRRRLQNQADIEVPSSPQSKHLKSRGLLSAHGLGVVSRRVAWWLGDPASVFGIDLGTEGEVIAATAWTLWLLALCFVQTGGDYFHLTKRFGAIAASQLPLHYLLALKSPWSPLQFLTRCSHESLNVSHQILGRIVSLLLYLHAAFYLNFYVQTNILGAKLKEAYVICGIVALLALTVVGTTALAPVRRLSYRVFYIAHVTLASALLPILFFHVSHIRPYLYETFFIYLLHAVLRFFSTKTLPGTLRILPETNLLEISIPLPQSRTLTYQPAQHAYLSLPSHPLLRTFRSNPFTVASLPYTDRNLRFVARILDGNTARLASTLKSDPETTLTLPLTLEGPYGLASHADSLLGYDRILFLAGGVGATFVVPLYRQLLADLSPSKGSYRRQKVSFVWVTKSTAEVNWAISEDEREKEGFLERLKICVTGSSGDRRASEMQVKGAQRDSDDAEEGIELEERRQLLPESAEVCGDTEKAGDLPVYAGRPDLKRLVEQTFSQGGGAEKVAVVVCGPRSLSRSLRREIAPWVKKGRKVWFWEEAFGL